MFIYLITSKTTDDDGERIEQRAAASEDKATTIFNELIKIELNTVEDVQNFNRCEKLKKFFYYENNNTTIEININKLIIE